MKRLFVIPVLFFSSFVFGQMPRIDSGRSPKAQVYKSLYEVQELIHKNSFTTHEISKIYFHEIIIGKYYIGIGVVDSARIKILLENYGRWDFDSLKIFCANYIKENYFRFRNILSGWRDEESFYEPNNYWLEIINKVDSNSFEAREIGFDLEFKDFIRQFELSGYIDENSESCEKHYRIMIQHSDEEAFSKKLLETIPLCEQKRKEFLEGKERLLKKYNYAPFTKILQDISEKEIIIFVESSEC